MPQESLTSKNYQKDRFRSFTQFDIERTLRENVFQLDQENNYIDQMVTMMLNQKMEPKLILKWLTQLENNAAEIIYMNTLTQTEISTYNFNEATMFKGRS